MANSYVNKVNMADGTTIIDISDTSIDVNKIPNGSVVYLATGERIVGEAIVYNVYNGLDKITEGYALDARQGKVLKDQIDGLVTGVSGVKGNAENAYRVGNVNLTPENIGAYGIGSLGTVANITDANNYNLYGTGLLQGSACANLPSSTAGIYFTVNFFGTMQIATKYGASGATEVYIRYYTNNQWYPWVRVDVMAVPSWAMNAGKPSYSASEVGAVDTNDIANNLTTTTSGKVLDARQGKALKDTVDGLITGVSGVKGNAENAYRTGQVNLTAENVGALSLSGGTMTGAIVRKSVNNWDTPPSETTYYNLISAYDDSNNYIRAQLQIVRGTAGNYGIYLAARSSGNGDKPFLGVSVDGSGNAGYLVSHPEVFRTTIGAASFSDIVVASGTYNFGSLAANSYSSATITIPTQPNLNYIVLVNTLTGNVTWGVQSKTTTSFAIYVRNVTSAVATASVTWAVIRM